jgi:hypothetical protein
MISPNASEMDLDLDFLDDDFDLIDDESDERFGPRPYDLKPVTKRIAVVDCETDPFAPGFLIQPFSVGFLTDDRYVDFWGDDCVEQFFSYLATLEDEYIIFAHNGGKFDFFFFLKWLDANHAPMIMNGRLVKVYFQGQEFRDSFAIIPERLGSYKKTEIDYNKFTRDRRERHRAEILSYQKDDCIYLYEQVVYFLERFGDKLTVASASLAMLNSYHGFERFTSDSADEKFRQYYFGGRCQCFETGILIPEKRWLMIDRNSMYPKEMRDTLHPISTTYELNDRITPETDFACIVAKNYGALPVRLPNGGLDFTCQYGTFYATIHEINAGLETGTLEIERVKHTWEFEVKRSFSEFIQVYWDSRLEAKALNDKLRDTCDKRIMNASYGKFALNPRKFKKWLLTIDEIPSPLATDDDPDGWTLHSSYGSMFIWERPNPHKRGFYNVATAASITGAARANLLTNLSYAKRPIYCDTDSIICEEFGGEITEAGILGGWKLEGEGTMAAIAGKKLYALFNEGETLKKASKGCDLTAQEIIEVCQGNEILYRNPVPAFSLARRSRHSREFGDGGFATFIDRKIRMTG